MEGHLRSLLVLIGRFGIGKLHRTLHILTNHQRTGTSILVPPLDQRLVVSSLITYLPINLGHAIIQPTVVHPQQDIRIEIVVVLRTVGVTTNLRTTLVTIDAKGRDTHLHPGLHAMDSLIELLHKQVHVIATPIVDILDTIRVLTELLGIGNGDTLHRIRIEIVVHVDTVHVIARHDVLGHLTDIIAILRNTRIQNQQVVILKTRLRRTLGDMVCSQRLRGLRPRTIRIDPGVQLHATLVALGNHPLQGIPVWRWCLALNTRQESAPGLQLTLVEGIAFWAHLEDNQVHTVFLQLVELIGQRLLHLLGSHTPELTVHTLYPRSPHLPLLGRGHDGHHTGHQYYHRFLHHLQFSIK